MKLFYIWLIASTILAFALFGIDKYKSIRRLWRIPEATLFTLALGGGALGALLGMYVFRHKTKHIKFIIGIPLCLGLNIIVFGTLIARFR